MQPSSPDDSAVEPNPFLPVFRQELGQRASSSGAAIALLLVLSLILVFAIWGWPYLRALVP
jgi:hypothetical protein